MWLSLRCPACGMAGLRRFAGSVVCRGSMRCGAIYPDGFVEQLALLVDDKVYRMRRREGELIKRGGELVLK